MGKIKFDLETKIKACKEYEKGNNPKNIPEKNWNSKMGLK